MLEYTPNYSVGRGTDTPFEQIGADFIVGSELASYLNQRFIPGVRAYPTRFQPQSSHFSGVWVEGVRLIVTDREVFDSERLGLEIAAALQKLYPGKVSFPTNRILIGEDETIRALAAGDDPRAIRQRQEHSVQKFLALREKYLLYR
jgi:uncharacterized protein YbbC (DUF1343 family)